jgi:hypothetical protein
LRLQQGSIEEQLAAARVAVEREYARLFRQLDEFRTEFGADAMIGSLTQEEYRAQVAANQELIVQQEQLAIHERNLNDLLSERTRRLQQIEERQNAQLITAADAYNQALEVTSELNPRIEKAADDARAFATAISGANPSPEMLDFIAKLDGVDIRLTESSSDVNGAALANLNQLETSRNNLISERNNLIEANQRLVDLGLITSEDAQAQAEAAYARTAIAIQPLIDSERELNRLLLDRVAISQTEFDSRMASLLALEQQLDYLDPRFTELKQGVDQIVTQEVVNFIDAFAQSIAGLATNSMSAMDALANMGLAFVNMIAQMLRSIALLIIQMLVLDAIQKITGIPVGALLRLNGGGGGGSGGVSGGGGLLGLFHGGTDHVGGAQAQRRSNVRINPASLAAIPRYHNGTEGVGLKRNERLSILEVGEKVISNEEQRREARAKAAPAGGGKKLRQVLAFGDDEIAGAMAGPAGEEVTVTHIRRNRTVIRQELGID